MEPKFQSSFIPKKAIDSSVSSSVIPKINTAAVVKNVDVLSVISTTIFLAALAVMGGLYGYKYYLNNKIAEDRASIEAARSAFDTATIQQLINADSRLTAIKTLLDNHVAVSRALHLMEELVVKKMRFVSLDYNNAGNGATLTIKGEVQSYNALAQQQNIFSKNEFMKNPSFYDFGLSSNGYVSFSFKSGVDPMLTSYKKVVESASGNSGAGATTTESTTQ